MYCLTCWYPVDRTCIVLLVRIRLTVHVLPYLLVSGLFEPQLEDVQDGFAEDEWQPLVVGDVLIHRADNLSTLLK